MMDFYFQFYQDSTGEYISAENKKSDGVYTAGLPCVTVLIGAFLRDSGVPVAGVINQPFYNCQNKEVYVSFFLLLLDNRNWKWNYAFLI